MSQPVKRFDNKDGRLRGRKLQERRLKVWTKDPRCAQCGKLTAYPAGFQLDHKVALTNGGKDTEANTQILCIGPTGCHDKKTAVDLGHRKPVKIGEDGYPVEP